MSDNNNRNQRNAAITGATAMAAALAAGLAFEHMHAQDNDRESVVQGVRRWISGAVSDVSEAVGGPTAGRPRGSGSYYGGGGGRHGAGGSGGGAGSSLEPPSAAAAAAYARRRLTRSEIDALPERVVTDVDAVDGARDLDGAPAREKAFCVVCREHYVAGDRLLRLPCFHEFHSECIRDYLESTEGPLCPICRHPVMFS